MSEKKSTSSLKVAVQNTEKEERPTGRKRPTVSNRSMSISLGRATAKAQDSSPKPKPKPKTETSSQKGTPTKPKPKSATAAAKPKAKPTTVATKPKTAAPRKKSPPKKRAVQKPRTVDLGSPRVLVPFMIAMLVLFATMVMMRPMQHAIERAPEEPIVVLVEPGMSATAVSQLLVDRNIVDDGPAVLAYFVEQGIASTLRSGSFIMYPGMDYQQIGDTLSPSSLTRSITAGPGFTIARIDALLVQRLGLEPGTFIKATEELIQAYHLGFAEGWLLGGTYEIGGAEDLARQMYEAMLGAVQANLSSPLLATYSIEELLIIASLIQAETQNTAEMRGISAVIHNRLAIDEPLGIDATTRYELDDWVSEIPIEALETHTPYNTRRKRGLPPTGISAPSAEAVAAAFFPEERPDLFYLHGLDKQIHFALTYDEHRENIRQYR